MTNNNEAASLSVAGTKLAQSLIDGQRTIFDLRINLHPESCEDLHLISFCNPKDVVGWRFQYSTIQNGQKTKDFIEYSYECYILAGDGRPAFWALSHKSVSRIDFEKSLLLGKEVRETLEGQLRRLEERSGSEVIKLSKRMQIVKILLASNR